MKAIKRRFPFLIMVILIGVIVIHLDGSNEVYNKLEIKNNDNIFDDISNFLYLKSNAIVTKAELSTGMYTDSNNVDYHVTFHLGSANYLLNRDQGVIALESQLNSTTEWIVDNKYRIVMYYEKENDGKLIQSRFYENQWVGKHKLVSVVKKIPETAVDGQIFIKYESKIGSVLGYKNGNDVRFVNNYLSCW